MKKIPEWQYPLYKESDKLAYLIFKKIGETKKYPPLVGSKEDINNFLKLLIASQKMKKYRVFRDIVLSQFEGGVINLTEVLKRSKKLKIPKGVDESWAIFQQDKRLCQLIDKIKNSRVKFQGTNNDINELIIRFFLSQLLQDWRGPLMAIILECQKKKVVRTSRLNKLLELWDYTEIF
ncbi:hypothetical protein HQ544_01550 [Candidatus Falkowbacteria bacterium]|nr:hypothetical protein [Candidatus Falkowbacteria bacterium]